MRPPRLGRSMLRFSSLLLQPRWDVSGPAKGDIGGCGNLHSAPGKESMSTISSTDEATGRVALVTGASRPYGLGVAVARELATHGFHAVAAGRDLDQTRLRAEE